MVPPSPLDDPAIARFAWTRYWRIMRRMGLFTLAVIAVSLIWLYRQNGFVSIHLYIAAAIGIGLTIMIGAALMGLVFLSNGTGHDAAVIDPLAGEPDQDDR